MRKFIALWAVRLSVALAVTMAIRLLLDAYGFSWPVSFTSGFIGSVIVVAFVAHFQDGGMT